jgi:hypothetical protein
MKGPTPTHNTTWSKKPSSVNPKNAPPFILLNKLWGSATWRGGKAPYLSKYRSNGIPFHHNPVHQPLMPRIIRSCVDHQRQPSLRQSVYHPQRAVILGLTKSNTLQALDHMNDRYATCHLSPRSGLAQSELRQSSDTAQLA